MINELIFNLNKDKMTFFKTLLDKDVSVDELRSLITQYIDETHQNKVKIIDDFMHRYECSIDNFNEPKTDKKAVDEILQEYFLVKHISTFLKKGHTPHPSKD